MNEELKRQFKEAVEKGRNSGRVLDISEAFKRYPVSDEAHKGNPDYFLIER